MTKTYDVIVLGVGGMGSATCYHLAKRGAKVLGLEQFEVGHDQGSSHGETRAVRMAYFEDQAYIPVLKRAYDLWDELCQESGQDLFHRVGVAIAGPSEGAEVWPLVVKAAQDHDLELEVFPAAEANQRWGWSLPEDFTCTYEKNAGYVRVEDSILAHAKLAKENGAEILENQKVISWQVDGDLVTVKTDSETYQAKKLVVTSGAWTNQILSDLNLPFSVHRNVLLWYEAPEKFSEEAGMPCFAFELPYANGFIYGFPSTGGAGLKFGDHTPGKQIEDPSKIVQDFLPGDDDKMAKCANDCFPGVDVSKRKKHATCMYTMTPDQNFYADIHPKFNNVCFAGGFSGHGYKFATVMGEILSDLALKGETDIPIDLFRIR